MAIKEFTVGKVEINGTELNNTESATLSLDLDTGETTSIGDDWRKLIALAKSWSVSLTVKTNPDDTAYAALRAEFISGDCSITAISIYEDASHYFSGSALMTNFAPGKSVGNVDSTSITIEGNSTLSYT